jgi:hypothetical protein
MIEMCIRWTYRYWLLRLISAVGEVAGWYKGCPNVFIEYTVKIVGRERKHTKHSLMAVLS